MGNNIEESPADLYSNNIINNNIQCSNMILLGKKWETYLD